MTKIKYYKKQMVTHRIVNQCEFLTEPWEREHMLNLLLAAFDWSEKTSEHVEPDAPYAIVKKSKSYEN